MNNWSKVTSRHSRVIPAKAGIQDSRAGMRVSSRENATPHDQTATGSARGWIPAFAGMTLGKLRTFLDPPVILLEALIPRQRLEPRQGARRGGAARSNSGAEHKSSRQIRTESFVAARWDRWESGAGDLSALYQPEEASPLQHRWTK
jgi:hypothetical protein